jgi:catechol 2,3-dioxygenase-like lactoylglutathione lyase family enzyme
MFKFAIPVLHVSSAAVAEAFYCDRLGFRQKFAYRFDDSKPVSVAPLPIQTRDHSSIGMVRL